MDAPSDEEGEVSGNPQAAEEMHIAISTGLVGYSLSLDDLKSASRNVYTEGSRTVGIQSSEVPRILLFSATRKAYCWIIPTNSMHIPN